MPLKVSDGIGSWIKDFKKSDAPQFKGKDEKERRDMAIAAYLDAKRGQKNEVLDTDQAMRSYRDKAKASKEKAVSSAIAKINKGKEKLNRTHPAGELKTMAKRAAGERLFTKRLLHKLDKRAAQKANEEVELDEGAKTHFVYQRGVPKTKQVVHRGTEQSSKDWIQKNAKHYIHKGRDFDIYKGKYPNVKPSDRVDFKYVAEEATDDFGKNFGKRIGMLMKGGKSAEYLKKKADQARQRNKALDPGAAKKGLGIGVIDKDKANKKRMAREEVELDEAKMTDAKNKEMMRKALGVSKLGPKHAHYTTAYANNGDFVVRDGAGRVVGRITKDELNEAKEPSMAKINAILNPTKNSEQGIQALMKRLKVDRKTAEMYMDKAIGNNNG